ncbi:hypothetical protein THH46_10365 [Pseudomonas sp. NA13]
MAIEDIKQLKTVPHQGPAQALLDQGWVLLAVCVRQDGADQFAEYHLGLPGQASQGSGVQQAVQMEVRG